MKKKSYEEAFKRVNELKDVKRKIQKAKAQFGKDIKPQVWNAEKGDYVEMSLEDVQKELDNAEKELAEIA